MIKQEYTKRFHMGLDERGVSLMAVMILTLMTGVLGVAALTMTGMENSMAGAVRMVEEGTHAAESCLGTAVRVITMTQDSDLTGMPAALIAPLGPVPTLNAAFLTQEINGSLRNNPDIAVGAGNSPNLSFIVNNYAVSGDIDFLYSQQCKGCDIGGGGEPTYDYFYRVDCTAANAATGATSRVIAVFDCLGSTGDGCKKRPV